MSKIINDALDIEEYRAVFLMMDLKTVEKFKSISTTYERKDKNTLK